MNPIRMGRYILLQRLAHGGMGEVFLAVTRNISGSEKVLALKKLLPQFAQDAEFLTRFKDESRLIVSLNHPNLIQVFEIGQIGEELFIAMEFVEGFNLGELLDLFYNKRPQKKIPIPATLYIIREVLAALEYCHRHTDRRGTSLGVVHRDVSPSNVLISYEAGIKLADFGLALFANKVSHTRPHEIFGHWGYIAPEMLEGRKADHRTDLFSVGVLLFELLTGERFLPDTDISVVRHKLATRSHTPCSSLRPEVDPELDGVVLKALALNPDHRYASARDFADALQAVLVRLDPLYSADTFRTTVIEPNFQVAQARELLCNLLDQINFDEVENARPQGRVRVINEAIPLSLDDNALQTSRINRQRKTTPPFLLFEAGELTPDSDRIGLLETLSERKKLDEALDDYKQDITSGDLGDIIEVDLEEDDDDFQTCERRKSNTLVERDPSMLPNDDSLIGYLPTQPGRPSILVDSNVSSSKDWKNHDSSLPIAPDFTDGDSSKIADYSYSVPPLPEDDEDFDELVESNPYVIEEEAVSSTSSRYQLLMAISSDSALIGPSVREQTEKIIKSDDTKTDPGVSLSPNFKTRT